MILFNSETSFSLNSEENVASWLSLCISKEGFKEGEINFIFCDDAYLLEKNIKYLKHNTLTDVIGFDYSKDKLISGDIFISVERVLENSKDFKVAFIDELHRVMIHGVLHFFGYADKSSEDKLLMRSKEDYYLSLRTF
jgi:rRNA maturation RNase YbeY